MAFQNCAYDLSTRLWDRERTNGARGSNHRIILKLRRVSSDRKVYKNRAVAVAVPWSSLRNQLRTHNNNSSCGAITHPEKKLGYLGAPDPPLCDRCISTFCATKRDSCMASSRERRPPVPTAGVRMNDRCSESALAVARSALAPTRSSRTSNECVLSSVDWAVLSQTFSRLATPTICEFSLAVHITHSRHTPRAPAWRNGPYTY